MHGRHAGNIAPPFSTSAVDGDEWWAPGPSRFTSCTCWIGGWVNAKRGSDAVENIKIFPCQELNPGCPARSPLLYRQSYPGLQTGTTLNELTSSGWRAHCINPHGCAPRYSLLKIPCTNPWCVWYCMGLGRVLYHTTTLCFRASSLLLKWEGSAVWRWTCGGSVITRYLELVCNRGRC
jgi:hypothetical protein